MSGSYWLPESWIEAKHWKIQVFVSGLSISVLSKLSLLKYGEGEFKTFDVFFFFLELPSHAMIIVIMEIIQSELTERLMPMRCCKWLNVYWQILLWIAKCLKTDSLAAGFVDHRAWKLWIVDRRRQVSNSAATKEAFFFFFSKLVFN